MDKKKKQVFFAYYLHTLICILWLCKMTVLAVFRNEKGAKLAVIRPFAGKKAVFSLFLSFFPISKSGGTCIIVNSCYNIDNSDNQPTFKPYII